MMNVDPEYYLVRFSEQYAIVCAIINSEKEEQYHFLGGVIILPIQNLLTFYRSLKLNKP